MGKVINFIAFLVLLALGLNAIFGVVVMPFQDMVQAIIVIVLGYLIFNSKVSMKTFYKHSPEKRARSLVSIVLGGIMIVTGVAMILSILGVFQVYLLETLMVNGIIFFIGCIAAMIILYWEFRKDLKIYPEITSLKKVISTKLQYL